MQSEILLSIHVEVDVYTLVDIEVLDNIASREQGLTYTGRGKLRSNLNYNLANIEQLHT